MRILLVKNLKGGERLAEPVITDKDKILIPKGTVLKPEYLDLLSFLDILSVSIEDPYESEENPHYILEKEKIIEYICRVQDILENHVYQKKNALKNIKNIADDIVDDLMKADENIVVDVKERNGNLYSHTIAVTILSVIVARKLQVEKEKIYSIALGCLLHDLGLRYITVPYINQDMSKCPPSELLEYKKHTIMGYSALEKEEWIDIIAKKMILSHHERMDGSGFPLHQKSYDLTCNILQACDAFDCYISGIENKRMGVQQALEYLVEEANILFEPKIVKIIEGLVARYPVGTRVKLNTGEFGIVVSQTENALRPIVEVLDEKNNLTSVRYQLDKIDHVLIIQVEN